MTTEATDAQLGETFDHHSQRFRHNSHQILSDLRTSCPVAHSDNYDGFWVATTYADVAEAARDDDRFASHNGGSDSPFRGVLIPPDDHGGILETDPPRFLSIRRAVNGIFSPASTERMKPEILEYTTWCIDHFIEVGRADLIADLAAPVPALLTLRILGLPLDEWHLYAEAMHSGGQSRPQDPADEERDRLHRWARDQVRAAAIERRAEPRDDLLSAFATLRIDGDLLPLEEVVGNGFLMLAGGLDTTTGLLGHTFSHLERDRSARKLLASDPRRLAKACEEYLRYFTPVQALARTVTTSCTLGGQALEENDRLLLSWASANLDPAEFQNPERIQLDRSPNRHLAFGVGIHRCIGSNIARAVWTTVVSEVLRRLPDFQIDQTNARRYANIGVVNGWMALPVEFSPASRTGSEIPGLASHDDRRSGDLTS